MGIGQVGLIERQLFPSTQARARYSIRRLVSPADEAKDLSDDEQRSAGAETVRLWKESTRKNKSSDPPEEPSGRAIRLVRPKDRGVLLIYPLDGARADCLGIRR